MNRETLSILVFITLCVTIYTLHANTSKHVRICENGGAVLFLSDKEYSKLMAGGVDVGSYRCVERILKNEEIWELKTLYKHASAQ